MRFIIIGVAAASALALALPAAAQIERLPETSRSEAHSSAINNSLAAQGRARVQSHQDQFEINSLRTENSMRSVAPIIVAPPIAGPAPIR
jgi:hypothetical protein